MPSDFSIWFERQYGKRPGGSHTTAALYIAVQKAAEVLGRATRMRDARVRWETEWDAAYKAWLAREAQDAKA
jgi:hypothetical protein